MVYDARQDIFGEVDLDLQGKWLKFMEDVHPESWTDILLSIKEYVSKFHGVEADIDKVRVSWYLTCAADALSSERISEKEAQELIDVFMGYLQKKRAGR